MKKWLEKKDVDKDVEIVKVEKAKVQKKMTKWVSSSFDDFALTSSLPVKSPLSSTQSQPSFSRLSQKEHVTPCKRSKTQSDCSVSLKEKVKPSSNLWVEVYKPRNRADLAVHKKKVDDVYEWLSQKLAKPKRSAPILVLTGPPGAGKTACIEVLCQELGISIQQWENSLQPQQSAEEFNKSSKQEYSKVDVYTSQSQANQFSHFLLRANKYSPISGLGLSLSNTQTTESQQSKKNTVILVEDLPNIFSRDAEQLHTILRKYNRNGQSPLVFIVTEFNSSGGSLQKLFPKELLNELHITHINVNPVAPTMMTKCLKRVISQISGQKGVYTPSQSMLELISQGCAGDLRAAFNMLQFSCSKKDVQSDDFYMDFSKSKKGSESTSCKNNKSKPQATDSIVGVKDTSVFLFHAVGKILYFKRGNPVDFPKHPKLPTQLSNHERDPLLLDPEEVVAKVHVSSDMFTSFLHENYLSFMTSVEDLEKASEYFSDGDVISSLWSGREALEGYSLSIATRGYIHSNSDVSRYDSVRKNQGWRPIHKSQWFPSVKQASQNVLEARQLFRGCHWEPEVLCTELIPYINITNPTMHDPGQITFVQQMTQFSGKGNSFRSRKDQLNEKDAIEEDDEEEDATRADTSHNTSWNHVEQGGQINTGLSSISTVQEEVNEDDWGSDWEADDEDLLGSQNNVKAATEPEEEDFVIEDFDD